MISNEELFLKGLNLEKLLDQLSPDNKNIELCIYALITKARRSYNNSVESELDKIIESVKDSPLINLSKEHKMKSNLLAWKDKFGHAPAYIFVLNYNPEKSEHYNHTYKGRVLGSDDRDCLGKHILDEKIISEMEEIAYEDCAILVQPDGIIYATNVQLVDVNPTAIDNLPNFDYSSFHSRHYSALGASFHLDTVIYTLSESGHVRRFKSGAITFSTSNKEQRIIEENVKIQT